MSEKRGDVGWTQVVVVVVVLVVLLLLCASSAGALPPGGAGEVPGARLSWDAKEVVRDLDRIPAEWQVVRATGETTGVRGGLHLSITAAQPLDSLHLVLRWVSADEGAYLEFHGWSPGRAGDRAAAPASGQVIAFGERLYSYRPLAHWETEGSLLREAAERDPGGQWSYRLIGHLTLHGNPTAAWRIAAAVVTGWSESGETVQLGSPSVSLGGGWQLQFPPLLTELAGRINKRFISGRMTLRGVGFDRLVGIWLRDASGRDCYPTRVDRISDRRIDLAFGNTGVAEGVCDLYLQDPDGAVQRFEGAVLAAFLEEQASGDTNHGSKPGRPD